MSSAPVCTSIPVSVSATVIISWVTCPSRLFINPFNTPNMSEINLSKLTVPALKTLCRDRKLVGFSKMKKEELVMALSKPPMRGQPQASDSPLPDASQTQTLNEDQIHLPPRGQSPITTFARPSLTVEPANQSMISQKGSNNHPKSPETSLPSTEAA